MKNQKHINILEMPFTVYTVFHIHVSESGLYDFELTGYGHGS
jgi:hypothetical protein